MMNEIVKDFKNELENLYKEMYNKLDDMICNALVVMSFYNEDGDKNLDILQEVIINVAQEQMAKQFGDGESN